MTKDWTPLGPIFVDHKFYTRDIGSISDAMVKGSSEKVEPMEISKRE
jgi:hypothetical protein